MGCIIKNIRNKGVDSILASELEDIYRYTDEAQEAYDKIASSDFISKFGDWVNTEMVERVGEGFEPLLHTKVGINGAKSYYFIGEDEETIDLITREFQGFDSGDLTAELKEVTDQLSAHIFNKFIKENFNDISNIPRINIVKEIENYVQKAIHTNYEYLQQVTDEDDIEAFNDTISYLELILEYKDEFKTEIIDFFNSKKLNINEEISPDDLQASQADGLQGSDLSRQIEKNTKDNANANVKLMMSFLPQFEFDKATGKFEQKFGNYLGRESFMATDVVHKELLNALTDIISIEGVGSTSDIYEQMIGEVSKLAVKKPYFNKLLEMLDGVSEDKKSEFVSAMFNSKVNYITSIKSGSKEYSKYKYFNASKQKDKASKLLSEWYMNFRNKFLIKDGSEFDSHELNVIYHGVNKVFEDVKAAKRGIELKTTTDEAFIERFSPVMEDIINILEDLGITNLSESGMIMFLNQMDIDNEGNDFEVMYESLYSIAINLKRMLVAVAENKGNLKFNPIADYKSAIFDSLAKAQLFYSEDKTDDTVIAGNKMYYTITKPSFISNQINRFKQTDLLSQITKKAINKSSQWAQSLLGNEKSIDGTFKYGKRIRKELSDSRLKKLELGVFNSVQEEGKAAEAVDNVGISYFDQIVDEMNKVLNGAITDKNGRSAGRLSTYSTTQAADKSTRHEITIDYFNKDVISHFKDSKMILDDKIVNIFVDYFEDEVNRMREAYRELTEMDSAKHKIYYHVNKEGEQRVDGRLVGNAFKSQLFPQLSALSMVKSKNKAGEDVEVEFFKSKLNQIINIYDTSNGDIIDENEVGFTASQKEALIPEIHSAIEGIIASNFTRMLDIGLIMPKTTRAGVMQYNIRGLDMGIISEYKDLKSTNSSLIDARNIVADYTVNSLIANVEYTKLFTGDTAMYKNIADFFKRVPATYTDGTGLRLGLTEGDANFNIAVIEDQYVASKFLKVIKEGLDDTNLSDSEKKYILKSYESINSTDAQAWISPERWAFIIHRSGKWNAKYDSVYAKIKGDNLEPLTAEEFKYVAQPLKGVYYGLVDGNPVYLKYSQAVLTKQMAKGSQLEDMLKLLKSNKVDELITFSGIKVGANIPGKITDADGNIDANAKLEVMQLSNADWKLQQDLPTKLIKATLLGSQIQKNILGSINNGAAYYLKGGEIIQGDIMIETINDVISSLSDMGIAKLSKELGMDDTGKIDKEKYYKSIEKSLLNDKEPINIVRPIQKGLPIDAIPNIKDKMYNALFSKIKKAAVKIKTNGGSFIQMANFGLDVESANNLKDKDGNKTGVTWLVEKGQLKPPIPYTDADGNKRIRAGQIFISHAEIAKYIPNYASLSMEELNRLIPEDLRRAIGYRIPNQGMSSNDHLEIVGILPQSMGDTIVAYTEIPVKTGSDFDIDKMYIMLPSFKANYSKRGVGRANAFIKESGITFEEIREELEEMQVVDSEERLNKADMRDLFVQFVLLDEHSDSKYQEDFLKVIKEGDVESLSYIHYNVNSTKNSRKATENRLFELYWSILSEASTYGELVTPIDFPHLANAIDKLHGKGNPEESINLKMYDPLHQLLLKERYHGGKAGVGGTANHLVDHNRSKPIEMALTGYYLGVGHENENHDTRFDKEYSEKLNGTKYKIAHTILAFLNLFVDNAKDSKVSKGNFNTYTTSVTFTLVRAGVHPDWIVAFMGQPILKEVAEFTTHYESKGRPKEDKSKSSLQVILDKYVGMYDAVSGEDLIISKIPLEVTGLKELQDNVSEIDKNSPEFLYEQIKTLLIFKEWQKRSKVLSNSVSLSRFDTEGAGKNNIQMAIYYNKVIEFLAKQHEDEGMTNHIKKYILNGKLTSLGTQLMNTVEYSRKMLDTNPDLFLMASTPVNNLFNEISASLLKSYGGSKGALKDETLGKLLSNELYAYIMSDFHKFRDLGNPTEHIKSTIDDILAFKQEEALEGEDENIFLKELDFFEGSFGIFSKGRSTAVKNELYRSFRDLMEIEPDLADNIISSLFLQNGFSKNLIDFREFIPHEWFIENDIRGFFKQKSKEITGSSLQLDSFKDQFMLANVENDDLIANISGKVFSGISYNERKIKIAEAFMIDPYNDDKPTNKYILGKSKEGNIIYPNYLKTDEKVLFKLQGYLDESAIYQRINIQGMKDKTNHTKIKEYDYRTNEVQTSYPDNQSLRSQAAELSLSELKEDVKFIQAGMFSVEQMIPNFGINELENMLKIASNALPLLKSNRVTYLNLINFLFFRT